MTFMLLITSIICLTSLAFAYNVTMTNFNSTLAQVKIENATNLYSYEINFVDTSASSTVIFYDTLGSGAATTTGTNNRVVKGQNILSVYASILNSSSPGVNITSSYVFNITHSGTILLRQSLNIDASAAEESKTFCTPSWFCAEWSSCVGGVQSRTCVDQNCSYDDNVTSQSCGSSGTTTTGGGGGGGGSGGTQSLKIEFGHPNIQENGYIEVPVTIKNAGTTSFSNLKITGYLMKNNQLVDTSISISKTLIESLSAGSKEDITVSANIKENDVSFYELVVQVDSTSPVFSDSSKILFTFIGVEGGKVLKVVAFTSGLIEEHPECLELKDMIASAQEAFDSGNTELALQKANQAVEACKNYIESPLKPIVSQKQYDAIPFYLGIGITSAIVIGIVFNLYRSYVFKRRYRRQPTYP